ncbi:unnamed protein product, partial [Mesorhabditis belari]|uniref:Uncharacterized protein n=1 Tax=Mesorhabditis belari TaxID=2138241 RepID=A0AAF3F8Q3_9BILA
MLIYTFENGWKTLLCFFANPILLQNAIICERIFATYYIWHYENLEKAHVYKIVLFGLFCCSGTCSVFVPIWFTIAPVTAIAVAMSFYIVFALIMFLIYWYLWVHNHDVLKLLRIFVGFDTAFVGANCLFGIIVMLITDQEKPSGQVALQLLELSIAVYTLSMLLLSLYFVKDWGEQFKKRLFNCFGRNLRLLSSKNSIVPLNSIQETEIYFNYYTQNWN